MKRAFLGIALLCLLVLGAHDAQAHDSGYYAPSWDGNQYPYPERYDPYYEMHVMHYQLYRPQFQSYPVYPSCCITTGIVIQRWSRPVDSPAKVAPNSRPRATRRR